MIYCRVQDCEVKYTWRPIVPGYNPPHDLNAFRASRYFNEDGDDVTTILPADLITVINLDSEPIMAIVEYVDDDGWIIPIMPWRSVD